MTELLLLRHAEPESAGLYIGRGSNPELSRKGRLKSDEIAPILALEKPERLYSSPLKRAWETITPTARKTGLDTYISEGLSEIDFGEWEGLGWKEIEDRDPELWHSWLDNPWENPPPGGETLKELQKRVIASLTEIINSHPGEKVLIATHGGPIRVILGYALSLEPTAFWTAGIDYACLCRFHQQPLGALDLLQWNVPLK